MHSFLNLELVACPSVNAVATEIGCNFLDSLLAQELVRRQTRVQFRRFGIESVFYSRKGNHGQQFATLPAVDTFEIKKILGRGYLYESVAVQLTHGSVIKPYVTVCGLQGVSDRMAGPSKPLLFQGIILRVRVVTGVICTLT